MIETIEVKKREARGTRANIKIRDGGLIPAILYGHGEENVSLSVSKDTINTLIKHGTKVVNLTGDVNDTALMRAVQWSSMGDIILHVDFARVSRTESVEVTLPVQLHGEASTVGGGQFMFISHELTVRCPASSVPEYIVCDISSLTTGHSIHVSELKLPEGVTAVTLGSLVVAQVVAPGSGGGAAATADDAATAS